MQFAETLILQFIVRAEGREKVEHFIDCYKEPKRHPPGHSRKHLDCHVEEMEVRQIKKEKFSWHILL